MQLAGKIAIITGAGRGIGRGIAEVFARHGAKVVVATRTERYGVEVVEKIRGDGGDAHFIQTELGSPEEIQRIVDETVKVYGGLDIVVHNAAFAQIQPVKELTDEFVDKTFTVNVKAGIWLAKASIPLMKARGRGRILFTSSVTAHRAIHGSAAYSISKAGLNAFIRCGAMELAEDGITVNGVEPGIIKTDALEKHNFEGPKLNALLACIPQKKMGTPADIGEAMAYLASDGAGYVTGQTIIVDGGLVVPENGAFMIYPAG